jgi:hypothetical protein
MYRNEGARVYAFYHGTAVWFLHYLRSLVVHRFLDSANRFECDWNTVLNDELKN